MSCEGFYSLSARYPPHSYFLIRSRRQILSVRRKYYAIDRRRVSVEGFYSFFARYPPHSYSIVIRSRRQILSVRRKYYASDSIRVSFEGFDSFSSQFFLLSFPLLSFFPTFYFSPQINPLCDFS